MSLVQFLQTYQNQNLLQSQPKKASALKYENNQTMSLMCHVIKILLCITLNRWKSEIRSEVCRIQFCFVEEKGTNNTMFILPNLVVRGIKMQKKIYAYFNDYSKAFDKVKHHSVVEILKQLNCNNRDIRHIINLYWRLTAAIRIGNDNVEWKSVKRGVRQGFIMSSDILTVYCEITLKSIEKMKGIKVGRVK